MKRTNAASFMMLLWLAVTLLTAVFLPKWADFSTVSACMLPLIAVRQKIRGKTFGTRDCNTVKYRKDYPIFFLFTISGTVLLGALTSLAFPEAAAETGRTDFFYRLIFFCFLPAFFEEYLLRGGILGALAPLGGSGVWQTAIFFSLMHISPRRMPYALFAGLCLSAMVYLSENIYLGMLLHFLCNLLSLCLSYLPGKNAQIFALGILAAVFVGSFLALWGRKLFSEAVTLLKSASLRAVLSPGLLLFALLVLILNLL